MITHAPDATTATMRVCQQRHRLVDSREAGYSYGPNDNGARATCQRELQLHEAGLCDTTRRVVVFDGTQAHEVEPYIGVRASIVWYAVAESWEMDASIRATIGNLGFRPPWRWEECQRQERNSEPTRFVQQPKSDHDTLIENVWITGGVTATYKAVCTSTDRPLQTIHGIFFTHGGKVLERITFHSTHYQVVEHAPSSFWKTWV